MSAKKPLTILAGLIFLNLTLQIQAQGVAIHPTGAEAHSSAMLDISSTNMGLLIPPMSTEERNGIAPPAESLMIYNTDTYAFETYILGKWRIIWTA